MKPVYVVGSANIDRCYSVTSFPRAGETLNATAYAESLGGKGANQAAASALAGGLVRFIGAVGDDAGGASVLHALEARGVETTHLTRHEGTATGNAAVVVDETGENLIIVAGGANLLLSGDDVRSALDRAESGSLVVAQGEIPVEAIAAAAERAQSRGLSFLLNLAPIVPVDEEILRSASDATDAAARLRDHLRIDVIATLGGEGCVVMATDGDSTAISSPAVEQVVDTTGAGDAFVGILAARLSRGDDLVTASRAATVGASFAVQRQGTAESYPDADQLDALIASLYSVGDEPDARFTLANERTFLAWIRTALALLAGGVALDLLGLDLHSGFRLAASLTLVAAGIMLPLFGWLNWAATERALRRGDALPGSWLGAFLGVAVTVAGVLLALAILLR
jgi:ribokinase